MTKGAPYRKSQHLSVGLHQKWISLSRGQDLHVQPPSAPAQTSNAQWAKTKHLQKGYIYKSLLFTKEEMMFKLTLRLLASNIAHTLSLSLPLQILTSSEEKGFLTLMSHAQRGRMDEQRCVLNLSPSPSPKSTPKHQSTQDTAPNGLSFGVFVSHLQVSSP